MKRKHFRQRIFSFSGIVLTVFFGAVAAGAQTIGSISPVLVGSTGNFSSNGGLMLSSSTGEVIVPTTANGAYILTQGFQQPSSVNALVLNAFIDTISSSCAGANDGEAIVHPAGGTGPYAYAWSTNDTTASIDSLSPGTYSVTVSDAGGLTTTQTFTITENNGLCGVHVYHGLTPNADGHNDIWIIDHLDLYLPNHVTVYNRWGMLVWQGDNYDNQKVFWDGKAKDGSPLTDGTYFYVIEVDGYSPMNGWVELSH
ncbi:MAG TPA: gliding motility-associated C-terminal domain-containing protein [Bacteroidia bacterium]|nr:gliding motility-associated C-terminal domain-containing protein [Bacteroidia bacterium]